VQVVPPGGRDNRHKWERPELELLPAIPSRYGARFRQKFTLEDAIGSHACSLEANTHVTNGIPLGSSLLLPVDTVNCIQTLKANAAFLTPEVVLQAAQAFADGMTAVKDAPAQLEHVQSSAMTVYMMVMPRWNELTNYAANHSIPWPLSETTAEEAFTTFSTYFHDTTARYNGAAPVFSEGGGPGNLTKLHHQLFPPLVPCSKGWARVDPSARCTPTCSTHASGARFTAVGTGDGYRFATASVLVPGIVNVSTWYGTRFSTQIFTRGCHWSTRLLA
jgi:hypothetical protein